MLLCIISLICITADDYTILIAANLVLGVEINVTNAATFQLYHNILNSFDRRAEDDKVANDRQIPPRPPPVPRCGLVTQCDGGYRDEHQGASVTSQPGYIQAKLDMQNC